MKRRKHKVIIRTKLPVARWRSLTQGLDLSTNPMIDNLNYLLNNVAMRRGEHQYVQDAIDEIKRLRKLTPKKGRRK